MEYIQGTERDQILLFSNTIDEIIKEDNAVRVIDVYVENLDVTELGFKIPELKTGKPPYRPQLLLKIYLYGYLEKIRSSRRLEEECQRNTELIWLTEQLAPDFKTIADFRKDNKKGIKNVYKEFLSFCKRADLLSLEKIGIDSTKIRAQNNLNNIYKRESIGDVKKRIEEKINEYLEELERNDRDEKEELGLKDGKEAKDIIEKLKELKKYKNKVEVIKELFEDNPELKIYFANDNDSRFQKDKGKVNAGYNVQTAVDDKNKLIIANEVTNKSNDLEQMSPMIGEVEEIKKELKIENKTEAIMDAGYFSEKEILNNINKEGIEIIVSDKKEAEKRNDKSRNKTNKDKIPAEEYEAKDFKYDKTREVYICPEGKELHKTHTNAGVESSGRLVYEYQCKECADCGKKDKCTKNKRGRAIKVSANIEAMEKYKEKMQSNEKKKLILKRKEIVEHPFGTIKRNLGYTYFMQKGLDKVKAEFNFICFIYNFKRVLNILGVKGFLSVIENQKQIKLAVN
jgi:transposase